MTKKDELKSILRPLVQEIIMEAFDGRPMLQQEQRQVQQKTIKRDDVLLAKKKKIMQEQLRENNAFSGIEDKFSGRVSENKNIGEKTQYFLNKLDEDDFKDTMEDPEDEIADTVISEMNDVWAKMMKGRD